MEKIKQRLLASTASRLAKAQLPTPWTNLALCETDQSQGHEHECLACGASVVCLSHTPTHRLLTHQCSAAHLHAPAPDCSNTRATTPAGYTSSQGKLRRGSSTKADDSLTTETNRQTHAHTHEAHLLNDARHRPIRSSSSSALRRDDRIDGWLAITVRQSHHGVAHTVHSHVRERLLRPLVPWSVVRTVIDTWWFSEARAFAENGAKARYARNRSLLLNAKAR
jgi:hypothetical protein